MKKTISKGEFIDEFRNWDTYKENFSIGGLMALYDYLVEYEECIGGEVELDVVALCCEYSEYESANEAAKQYNGAVEASKDFDDEDREAAALAWLEDQTTVIPVNGGGVIIQNF